MFFSNICHDKKLFEKFVPDWHRWSRHKASSSLRCQFHQHFTGCIFVQNVCAKLVCTHILGLNFFRRKNIGANALIKCLWNWRQAATGVSCLACRHPTAWATAGTMNSAFWKTVTTSLVPELMSLSIQQSCAEVTFSYTINNISYRAKLSGGNNADSSNPYSNNIDTIFTCQQSRLQQSRL